MNCIKNQIRGSEIGSYVGGDVHIENINLVISPAGDGKEEFSTGEYSKVFRDKKQYFIDKWNADLFLHHSGSGRELTLRQVFIFPEYKIMGQQYDDLGQRLEDFRESDDRSMLLLGTPGMGKTSIIACLAQRHRDDGNMLFLKFRDLGTDLTDGENLLTSVCRIMGCRGSDLSGKMLIIDGFDEWRPAGDKNRLLGDFMLDTANLDGVRVLITSRHNYVDLNVSGIDQVLELQPFSEKKIRAFYRLFCGVELPEDMEIRNPEVLGIPVILYMALGIGADITEAVSKCGLYEKLFALEGGIFDRFKAKGQKPYEDGSHPVQYAKRELKTVLQRLAFELFKGNRDSICDKEYESIVQDIMGKGGRIAYDFPVKNLLEGDGTIEFVHKSIYEYFVAEYIYGKMRDGLQSENRETMAGICGGLLGFAELTDEIYAFLEHFISHSWGEYDWNFVYSVFLLMLKKGMTCFDSTASDVNVIVREKRIFGNMLKIIHLNHGGRIQVNKTLGREFACYIRLSGWFARLDLSDFELRDMCLNGMDLRRANLSGADLGGADLQETNLSCAKMQKVCLVGANLSWSDLSGADLSGADLSGADLAGAVLQGAVLKGASLIGANLSGADVDGADLTDADFGGAEFGMG